MSVTMISSNGLKYMPGDQNFYDWITATVKTIFTQKNCGDGTCDVPEEYPGFGPFGCISDCGVFQQRTPIRVNFKPAWRMSPAGNNVDKLVIGQGDKVDVQFKWNVWSETMGDYLLPKDTDKETLVFDAPDGRLLCYSFSSIPKHSCTRTSNCWNLFLIGMAQIPPHSRCSASAAP